MSNEMAVKDSNPQEMITLAIEKGADPAILSRLLDVQERWQANVAKRAYVAAMTAFKREAPAVLKKANRVNFSTQKGQTDYKYANLGSIVAEISVILGKHELSASWETAQDGNNITVTCHVTHVAGHRESVKLSGPSDQSGNKNAIQAVGSTVTYLQRYTLLAALGLATGEDDDGRQDAPQGKPPVQMPTERVTPQPETTAEGERIRVTIESVEKSGKRYAIKANGEFYSTFSESVGTAAMAIEGMTAILTYKVNGKFKNCVSIEPAAKEAEVVNEDGDPGATE